MVQRFLLKLEEQIKSLTVKDELCCQDFVTFTKISFSSNVLKSTQNSIISNVFIMWHISMWNRIFRKKPDFSASSYYILMIDYKSREWDWAQHYQKYGFRNEIGSCIISHQLHTSVSDIPRTLWCSSATHQVCNTSSVLILLNQLNYWEAVTLETHIGLCCLSLYVVSNSYKEKT